MEHAVRLPGRSRALVALVAFVLGAGGATLTYAALDEGSLDLTSGDAPAAKRAGHAGIGNLTGDENP
jgi:hypothetical protein